MTLTAVRRPRSRIRRLLWWWPLALFVLAVLACWALVAAAVYLFWQVA